MASSQTFNNSDAHLIGPIFDCDQLPNSISKHLGRPLAKDTQLPDEAPGRDESTFPEENAESAPSSIPEASVEPYVASTHTSPSIASGFDIKRTLTGGRAALAKRVTTNLDASDEIIYSMKEQGFRDHQIRDHLISLGLEQYNEKTISTRNLRIRRILFHEEMNRLDEEQNDWAEVDDSNLMAAYDSFAEAHRRERESLEDKQWMEIAFAKKKLDGQARHSRGACRSRYLSLRDGTARIPYDLDPDQEGRMAEIESQKERVENARAMRTREAMDEERKAQAKAREKLQREQQTVTRKEERKAELEALCAQRIKMQQSRVAEKDALLAHRVRAEQEKQDKTRFKAAERGRRTRERAELRVRRVQEREQDKQEREQRRIQQEITKRQCQLAETQQRLQKLQDQKISDELMGEFMQTLLQESEPAPRARSRDDTEEVSVETPSKAGVGSTSGTEDAPDPRQTMKASELRELCSERGLNGRETLAEMIKQLRDHDWAKTLPQLRTELAAKGAHKAGSKPQLIHRLAAVDAGLYTHPAPHLTSRRPKRKAAAAGKTADRPSKRGRKKSDPVPDQDSTLREDDDEPKRETGDDRSSSEFI